MMSNMQVATDTELLLIQFDISTCQDPRSPGSVGLLTLNNFCGTLISC